MNDALALDLLDCEEWMRLHQRCFEASGKLSVNDE